MEKALAVVRKHPVIVAGTVAVGAFVIGLLVAGLDSGPVAEWAGAGASTLAVITALHLANENVRELRAERAREWQRSTLEPGIDLTTRLLVVLEQDRREDEKAGGPCTTRSPEGVALAHRITAGAFVELGPLVRGHYGDLSQYPSDVAELRRNVHGDAYWDKLRDACTRAITDASVRLSDLAIDS
jgi:hypothetical protein